MTATSCWKCLDGRGIAEGGKRRVYLAKVALNDGSGGYAIFPTEADALAQKIAALLEANGQTLAEIEAEYMQRGTV